MVLQSAVLFEDFPTTFSGPVFRPGDDGYAAARAIWNMRTDDALPALIVRPRHVDDVIIAVRYAADLGIPVAIHSGGHGIDAFSMPADALVIDNSLLKAIEIDDATGRVTMQAGVRLGELDAATQAHGLVVPAGVVTDTGAAGLTLGGGIGHNARRLGATVDNVLSIDVVTADGRLLTASADENPDLFWGLRGAGHNLGVATSFTYQGHKLGPRVMSGLLWYSVPEGLKVFEGIDAVMAAAPRELAVVLGVVLTIPGPGVPPEMVGRPVINVLVVYTGELDGYDEAVKGVLALATPFDNGVHVATWLETNSIVDMFTPRGRRYRMMGGYVSSMGAELGRVAVEVVSSSPRPEPLVPTCGLNFPILGGKMLDADENSTAFSRTGAQWLLEATAQWDDRADDAEFMPWVESTIEAFKPFLTTNAYTNLSEHQGDEWLRGAYGSQEKWDRIVRLKHEWDPENRFAHNKNVARAAAALPETVGAH